jgi:hypothetical protein
MSNEQTAMAISQNRLPQGAGIWSLVFGFAWSPNPLWDNEQSYQLTAKY